MWSISHKFTWISSKATRKVDISSWTQVQLSRIRSWGCCNSCLGGHNSGHGWYPSLLPLLSPGNLWCSEMRCSYCSQGFTIIPSNLETKKMNETQVTMSGVLTQSETVYPAGQWIWHICTLMIYTSVNRKRDPYFFLKKKGTSTILQSKGPFQYPQI